MQHGSSEEVHFYVVEVCGPETYSHSADNRQVVDKPQESITSFPIHSASVEVECR